MRSVEWGQSTLLGSGRHPSWLVLRSIILPPLEREWGLDLIDPLVTMQCNIKKNFLRRNNDALVSHDKKTIATRIE